MSPLEEIKGWEVGELAAVVQKLGADNARKLSTCDKVSVEFTEESAVVRGTRKKAPPKQILSERRSVALPERSSPLDPDEFYKTRAGLYVWGDFRDRIVSAAKKVEQVPGIEIGSFDLIKDANDAAIRGCLPKGHVFDDPGVFCVYLATVIERQPDGQEGDLLANGSANIFYVGGANGGVFAVRVRWYSGHRKWYLFAPRLGGVRWSAGSRVFSRN